MPGPARSPSFWLNCALAACMFAVLVIVVAAPTADARPQAFTIPVNSTLDEPLVLPPTGQCVSTPSGKCTLRAAIMLANRITVNPVTINVPSGIYTLTIPAIGADADDTGDLNITGTVPITLAGAGAATTIIDANQIDRAFNIGSGTTATLLGLTVRNGSAVGGGGIFNQGTLTLNNSSVSGNSANGGSGGGIYSNSTLTLNDSIVSGNMAYYGGGIENHFEGTATLNNSTVSGNSSGGDGGGIYNNVFSTVTLNNSTVSGNSASGIYGGGGIFNNYTLTLDNSTVSGNSVNESGGGIDNFQGTATLNNSTVSGNRANTDGGGIAAGYGADLRLYNATIAFNRADADQNGSGSGGGIYSLTGTVQLSNTLLADNTGGPNCIITCFPASDDCKGTLNSGGYNLIRTTTGCTINNDNSTNLKGVDPLLGPLAANGGPTLTHALLRGSPAIDAGSRDTFPFFVATCSDDSGHLLTTDQRGWARPYPFLGGCDIGAYERGAFLYLPLIVR